MILLCTKHLKLVLFVGFAFIAQFSYWKQLPHQANKSWGKSIGHMKLKLLTCTNRKCRTNSTVSGCWTNRHFNFVYHTCMVATYHTRMGCTICIYIYAYGITIHICIYHNIMCIVWLLIYTLCVSKLICVCLYMMYLIMYLYILYIYK